MTAALRIARVRKASRALALGLVWVEAYLPLDVEAFGAFNDLIRTAGSAAAAAQQDPDLARRALTPVDTHGEAMLQEDVQALAHRFLTDSRKMDVQHDESARSSLRVVESFVNGPEVASPNFWPGAWVVVFSVAPGSQEWADIEAGRLNAVSFAGSVIKIKVVGGKSAA